MAIVLCCLNATKVFYSLKKTWQLSQHYISTEILYFAESTVESDEAQFSFDTWQPATQCRVIRQTISFFFLSFFSLLPLFYFLQS